MKLIKLNRIIVMLNGADVCFFRGSVSDPDPFHFGKFTEKSTKITKISNLKKEITLCLLLTP